MGNLLYRIMGSEEREEIFVELRIDCVHCCTATLAVYGEALDEIENSVKAKGVSAGDIMRISQIYHYYTYYFLIPRN